MSPHPRPRTRPPGKPGGECWPGRHAPRFTQATAQDSPRVGPPPERDPGQERVALGCLTRAERTRAGPQAPHGHFRCAAPPGPRAQWALVRPGRRGAGRGARSPRSPDTATSGSEAMDVRCPHWRSATPWPRNPRWGPRTYPARRVTWHKPLAAPTGRLPSTRRADVQSVPGMCSPMKGRTTARR